MDKRTKKCYGVIYLVTNQINGKVYIGQTTKNINKRFNQHCSSNSLCTCLNNAIAKYGRENFTIEQIDSAETLDELNQKEIYWISAYSSLAPGGYNLQTGGKRCEISDETRLRMSKAQKGKKVSDETRKKLSEILTGRKPSLETCKKLSEIGKNRKHTEEEKRKISESNKGRIVSEETRFKKGETHRKRNLKSSNSYSSYKGISWHKHDKVWIVSLRVNGNKKYLGRHKNEIEAAKIYDRGVLKYYGKEYYINFPELIKEYIDEK